MTRLFCGSLVCRLLIALPGLASAQYDFTTLGVPGAAYTLALGINNAGQIVGQYQDAGFALHGFLRDLYGGFDTLDVAGSTYTKLNGINQAGQSVGTYVDAVPSTHSFRWDFDFSFTVIDVPDATDTSANGINIIDQIVGGYVDAGESVHGFLVDVDAPTPRSTCPARPLPRPMGSTIPARSWDSTAPRPAVSRASCLMWMAAIPRSTCLARALPVPVGLTTSARSWDGTQTRAARSAASSPRRTELCAGPCGQFSFLPL